MSIAENTPEAKTLDIIQDQTVSLKEAIAIGGLIYPHFTDPDSVYEFLKKLKRIFKWDVYEAEDLGRGNSICHYPHDKMQMNLIIADTLYELENVVRFKISNYFREFTEETKRLSPNNLLDNDWYEYIEYGTKDPLIIKLEKIGYTREPASYIKANKDKLLIIGEGNRLIDDFSFNSKEFEATKNDDLKRETKKIKANLPELFK